MGLCKHGGETMRSSRMEFWIKSAIIPLALFLTVGITGTALFVGFREQISAVEGELSGLRRDLSGLPAREAGTLLQKLPVRQTPLEDGLQDPAGDRQRGVEVTAADGSRWIYRPDRGAIFREVLYRQRHVLVVAMIGMLLALELSIFLAHMMTRPIKRLVWGCERISAGEWVSFPDHADPSSEMGILYGAFNSMVDRLREWQKVELEASRIQRLAAFGQMMAGISHEIKNPLASMRINLDLLREHTGSGASEEWDIMSNELDRLNSTLTELLNFARPHPLFPENVPFGYLVQWCYRMVRGQLLRQSVDWKVTAPERGENMIWGDRAQLQQVLLNLVMNALQVQKEGGFVEVGFSPLPQGSMIWVRDGGPGIPASVASNIFDPFVTTRSDGTGMGLTVVLKIVNLHNGRVDVISDERGARFTVILPGRRKEGADYSPVDR